MYNYAQEMLIKLLSIIYSPKIFTDSQNGFSKFSMLLSHQYFISVSLIFYFYFFLFPIQLFFQLIFIDGIHKMLFTLIIKYSSRDNK